MLFGRNQTVDVCSDGYVMQLSTKQWVWPRLHVQHSFDNLQLGHYCCYALNRGTYFCQAKFYLALARIHLPQQPCLNQGYKVSDSTCPYSAKPNMRIKTKKTKHLQKLFGSELLSSLFTFSFGQINYDCTKQSQEHYY